MHRLVTLVSVVMLAASSVNCSNSSERSNPNILAPSDGAAARPGGGGSSGGSLTLAMVTDNNSDGLPSFGDTVTFVVQTTATAYPWVTLTCRQNGTVVYRESNGIFATSLSQDFTLGPTSLWRSGAAGCTATLENWDSYAKNGKIAALASTSFSVN